MNNTISNHPVNRLLEPETGAFIMRITLGSVLLAHSIYLKLMVFTLPGTAQFSDSIGLPGFMAYVVFSIEAVAGVALILGIKTRVFSAIVIPVLLGATWAHSSSGWLFTNEGGGWEFPAFWIVVLVVQSLLGDGAHAVQVSKFLPKTEASV